MFTLQELNIILDALGMAAKSNLRALNTHRNPEFKELHMKIDSDINGVQVKIREMAHKLPKK